MATMLNAARPPQPVKAEHHPSPPPETTPIKKEQKTLTNPTNPAPLPKAFKIHRQQQPSFINSVTQLRDLSTALAAFQRRYDELQEHLDFIGTAIDSNWPKHLDADPSQELAVVPVTETPASDTDGMPESVNSEQKRVEEKPSRSELEFLCEMMKGTDLRRYIGSRLSDIAKVRKEVTTALKCAPNPAKLVLECFGRFFLQSSKAFSKDSPQIRSRQASFLILECFLLMGCDSVEIEPAVKEEAELAAVTWRERLMKECSLAKANEIEARGLILFLACFGFPGAFKFDDVRGLIHSSNARKISSTLCRSNILIARTSEIIEWMVKKKMEVEAVDIVYIFGLENRFSPQAILTPFMRRSKETFKKVKNSARSSDPELIEANQKKLADLKYVLKCLEDHEIDPFKVLPEWNIKETICGLEKEIADLRKTVGDAKERSRREGNPKEKVTPKRKADEIESPIKTQEVRPSWIGGYGPQRQMAAGYEDAQNPYNGLTSMNLSDGRLSSHINSYSASPSVLHGYGAGPSSSNVISSAAGSESSVLAAGMLAGSGGILPSGSVVGVYGGVQADNGRQVMNQDHLYGWHGDAAFRTGGFGHSLAGQPAAIGVNGLYRPSSTMEGFAGFPDPPGGSNRSSSSDLYQFADAVVEGESYRSSGSRMGGAVPPPAHRPSYLY
ncbi:protein FRIGIDA [Cornus florida]|uniref:protein FRIGIDA n=1 Tax=Cornus florida TaxID=4283 RepID=UPI0028A2B240|nr:protein FRIGIDA [Cornus florida]